MEKSYVYCLKLGEFVKIGMSKHPEKRQKGIETSLPHDPVQIYLIETNGSIEARRLEKAIHKNLAQHKVRREWYKYGPDIDAAFTLIGGVRLNPELGNEEPQPNYDAQYRQVTRDTLVELEAKKISEECDRLGFPLGEYEYNWLKRRLKKDYARHKTLAPAFNTYVIALYDLRERIPFYDNIVNKQVHLDHIVDTAGTYDESYYHESPKYLLGIMINKYGLRYREPFGGLIKFIREKERMDRDDFKSFIINIIRMAVYNADIQEIVDFIYTQTACYINSANFPIIPLPTDLKQEHNV